MIWNHSAPEHLRTPQYKKYSFSSDYSVEYLGKSMFHIASELIRRPKGVDPVTDDIINAMYVFRGDNIFFEVPKTSDYASSLDAFWVTSIDNMNF